jgi:hypothetical protein
MSTDMRPEFRSSSNVWPDGDWCAGCGIHRASHDERNFCPPAKPPYIGIDAWRMEKVAGNRAVPLFGTDRTITADTLRPPAPRSLWARIADAWHAARSAWKWGPG